LIISDYSTGTAAGTGKEGEEGEGVSAYIIAYRIGTRHNTQRVPDMAQYWWGKMQGKEKEKEKRKSLL